VGIVVVGGLIHGALVIGKEMSSIGDPSSNHVDVKIASWSRGHMVGKEYSGWNEIEDILTVKTVVTNTDTIEARLAPQDFWLLCNNDTSYPAMKYGKIPLPATLAPGGKATGLLLFRVKKSDRARSAYYVPPSPTLSPTREARKKGWFGR
jgi:hypothetical protein